MRVSEAFRNEIIVLVGEIQAIVDRSFCDQSIAFMESSNDAFQVILDHFKDMENKEIYRFLMEFPNLIQRDVRCHPFLFPVYCNVNQILQNFGGLFWDRLESLEDLHRYLHRRDQDPMEPEN